jgi:cell division protein FtsX
MKRRFTILTVLLILVVGLGFYRGWFAVSRSAADIGSNKVNVNLTVDPDKMKSDTKIVKEKTVEPLVGATAKTK